MKTMPRIALTFSSFALAGLLYAQWHERASADAAPASLAQAIAAQSTAPAADAPLVNLPDFSRLVEQAGPAVVNIEASIGGGDRRQAAAGSDDEEEGGDDERVAPGEEDMPEFFKRFFGQPGGPGMPQPRRRGTSFGTGFVISADGYVLTNHHVIDGADEVIVHFNDHRELKAKVIGSDQTSDVAVLKVQADNLPTLRLGDSRNLKPGQWVMAIGSPFGFDHSVTAGVVSGLGRPSLDNSQRYVPFIQTDVAINRGNSGGPLLNTRGEVVGINSQIFSNSGGYMGVSFAIPIEVAMNAVRQIKETGRVSRGQLGVQIRDIQRDELGDLGLNRAAGAFVGAVQNVRTAAAGRRDGAGKPGQRQAAARRQTAGTGGGAERTRRSHRRCRTAFGRFPADAGRQCQSSRRGRRRGRCEPAQQAGPELRPGRESESGRQPVRATGRPDGRRRDPAGRQDAGGLRGRVRCGDEGGQGRRPGAPAGAQRREHRPDHGGGLLSRDGV